MVNKTDELLWQDAAGDRLYAAAPQGKHGTLVFIRPGEGEMYLPTTAVDALRTALAARPTEVPARTPGVEVSTDPADYLAEDQLTEARDLYDKLCARIRSNVNGRMRTRNAGPSMEHLRQVRAQVTSSRRCGGAAPDAQVGSLYRAWTEIAGLANHETTARAEAARLAALAGLLLRAYADAKTSAR